MDHELLLETATRSEVEAAATRFAQGLAPRSARERDFMREIGTAHFTLAAYEKVVGVPWGLLCELLDLLDAGGNRWELMLDTPQHRWALSILRFLATGDTIPFSAGPGREPVSKGSSMTGSS